jgi:hypothetical protein
MIRWKRRMSSIYKRESENQGRKGYSGVRTPEKKLGPCQDRLA